MTIQLSSMFEVSKTAIKKLVAVSSPVAVLAAGLLMPLQGYAIEFPDTGDRGAPSSTAGGGTRGGWCDGEMWWDENSLVALVPKNNVSTFVGDQAFLQFFAAPEFEGRTAEIYIKNADTNERIYQEQMVLSDLGMGKVIQVDLPATQGYGEEPLLAAGQNYAWEFAVICSTGDRTQDYYIEGLLQPVSPSAELSSQLASADLQEKAELYASAGIWQETLMIANQLSESTPSVLSDLLVSVGLDEVVAITRMVEADNTEADNAEVSNSENTTQRVYGTTADSAAL